MLYEVCPFHYRPEVKDDPDDNEFDRILDEMDAPNEEKARILMNGEVVTKPYFNFTDMCHLLTIYQGMDELLQFRDAIDGCEAVDEDKDPDLSNGKGTDFFFQGVEEPEKAAPLIVDLVQNRLPKFYGVSPQLIQVLTPMQRGVVGAACGW